MLTSPSARPTSADLTFFAASKVSRPIASPSPSIVTTRLTHVQHPRKPSHHLDYPQSACSTGPAISPISSVTKKRKCVASAALPRNVKRLRTAAEPSRRHSSSSSSPRGSSRQNILAPSPEPIYRSSRSRSVSTFHNAEAPLSRQCWIEEDGTPGPAFLSSEKVVKEIMRTYKGYFKNLDDKRDLSFEPHPTKYPVAELEYPNSGASERFILLAPKDKDHYSPIMCLEKSLYAIVESYLTPVQQSLFGTIPTDILSDVTPPPSPSPSPSPPCSKGSGTSCSSSLTSLTSSSSPPRVNYLRAIQRAIHRQDGPLFLKTISTINYLLRSLKYPALPQDAFTASPPNILKEAVRSWTATGIPQKVLMRIIDETYQRSVGPHIQTLKNYEAFSSEVYGELMPAFIADIIKTTGLNQDSLFMDLGSGVGNVVVQASLQSGCKSFGIELMPSPAKVAKEQLEQFKTRCRMWGVAVGSVELEEGDMLQSQRVTELIPKADVVLVNNKVFLESLNEALRPKFLDLKEGAIVVSLNPFVSSLNARVTERNVDDISAIFDVTERPYHSGSVSWGSGGGSYYIHRVDREGYASIRQRFENLRSRGTRRQQ